ncbi:MAG: hypothetical protein AB1489_27000 [Acidobacteriota bacterium]
MRKRIIDQNSRDSSSNENWLDLEHLAEVEITSEDIAHPIESALIYGSKPGWQASQPGEQVIRLLFDKPQSINHIRLVFNEDRQERRQEFLLRWSVDNGRSYQEIVRQQYNFNPSTTTREVEDYQVKLDGLTVLELKINPDISSNSVYASLAELRLGNG